MFSPILVSVYNRFDHFKNCIDALKRNELSKYTELYIVSDAALTKEDEKVIINIREYCKNISGFRKVNCIFREKNYGSFKSVNDAINTVLNKHSRIIFLEDDIIVSSDFLKFMNDGLEFYKDDKRIFSICGYNIPMSDKLIKEDIYIWQRFYAWGVAFWKDRWNEVDLECKSYNKFISNKEQVKKFNNIDTFTLNILKQDRKGEIKATDVRVSLHMFLNNQYTVFPIKTKVKNSGFDGTGEHCGKNEEYNKIQLLDNKFMFVKNIQENKLINFINRVFRNYSKKYFHLYILKIIYKRILMKNTDIN